LPICGQRSRVAQHDYLPRSSFRSAYHSFAAVGEFVIRYG